MESTTMNKYRPEVTGFGTTYTETLVFEIHITKDYEVNTSQEELELSTEEYEETVSWLTSPQEHRWLKITTQQEEVVKVRVTSLLLPHMKIGEFVTVSAAHLHVTLHFLM